MVFSISEYARRDVTVKESEAARTTRPPHQWARPRTGLVMPIYPSGHGAAALAGAQSSASRPVRRAAAVRSQANGIGSYRGG
jgi:hypothetical protein